jgi:hypothetical protein
LIKRILNIVMFALILVAVELSLNNIMSPDITSTLDLKYGEYGDSILPTMAALLPFTVLIEELGLRALPRLFCNGLLKGWPSLRELLRDATNPVEERKSVFVFMIVLFGVIGGVTHLSNIVDASSIDLLKYFIIHFIGGAYLGFVYMSYGFIQIYAVHILYDSIVLGIIVTLIA